MTDPNTQLTDEQRGLLEGANKLLQNPETRGEFLRLQKKVNPDLAIPEVDVVTGFEAKLAAETAARQRLEEKLATEKAERAVIEARDSLKRKHRMSDRDIEEVEKIMTEKHIASHETAANFLLQGRQLESLSSAQPATPGKPARPAAANPFVEAAEKKISIGQWGRQAALEDLRKARAGSK